MLLAIDTSAGTSVAIVDRDRGMLAEHTSADTRLHAEIIGTLILRCLRDADISPSELSGVVAGMGPGPFTGLRVGIAAAETFALGITRPVVRVVSHDAIALAHYAAIGIDSTLDPGPLLVVTDARRREVYWSSFHGLDPQGVPVRVDAPGLARPDELPSVVPGFDRYPRLDAAEVSAAALGLLAERMLAGARPFAASAPLYLREADAVASTTVKRVS
ncbi:MAG: tRNA (adenosine(37)-N6)-threonylcarbamoyltransferase complex dimerization subunit type 1 TsaB [Microbacteriaceae bacterium]|nr:tRNA (adenosine(37)-N6)-threonylcarbamoyltransferase complex dimerization subunit type 1 TsaB [Microbacteriaceae bacterium]